jgi:predicted PurR-regulated permease PerM
MPVGIIAIGLVSGLVVGLGTYLLGLKYPFVFAVLAFAAEFLPIVGPVFSAFPALLLASMRDFDTMLRVAAFYFIYYQLDAYFIAPRITGKLLDLHPVMIIIGILIGGEAGGLVGMLIAVPSIALMRILFKNIVGRNEQKWSGGS